MRRSLGCVVVLVLALGVRAQEEKKGASATKPVPREGNPAKRHQLLLERARKGNVDVLFLGDSITQGWEGSGKQVWKERFEPLKAGNFGIGGDRTQHVLWRITEGKELEGLDPKAVVLMIGTNNMGGVPGGLREGKLGPGGNSAEEIADGVRAVVEELRRKEPQAKVLLLAIFPRAEKADAEVRGKIKDVNQRIAKLADGKDVRYLDIGDKFLDKDGSLAREIMPDYLHLSPKGYEIWADAVEPALKELLKN